MSMDAIAAIPPPMLCPVKQTLNKEVGGGNKGDCCVSVQSLCCRSLLCCVCMFRVGIQKVSGLELV